jgi:hypothetical protein
MEPGTKAQEKPETNTEARPTISLQSVIVSGPDTSTFGGWGPKVNGLGNFLKTWN